jgi:hypothetical protein
LDSSLSLTINDINENLGALIGEELEAITNCRELFTNMAACEQELLRYIMYLVAL